MRLQRIFRSILVFDISARNVQFLPEILGSGQKHKETPTLWDCSEYFDEFSFSIFLPAIVRSCQIPQKLIDFISKHRPSEIAANISVQGRFLWDYPDCKIFHKNHFRIFTFTYVLYRRLDQIFQFWNSRLFWDLQIPNEIIWESSVLHMFYIGDSVRFFSSEIPDFFEICKFRMKSFWNLQFYIGFI